MNLFKNMNKHGLDKEIDSDTEKNIGIIVTFIGFCTTVIPTVFVPAIIFPVILLPLGILLYLHGVYLGEMKLGNNK